MAIDLRLAGRVLTVTVNGESASIDLANIRGDDGIRGPQGPAGDTTSVTELENKVTEHIASTAGMVKAAASCATADEANTKIMEWLGTLSNNTKGIFVISMSASSTTPFTGGTWFVEIRRNSANYATVEIVSHDDKTIRHYATSVYQGGLLAWGKYLTQGEIEALIASAQA